MAEYMEKLDNTGYISHIVKPFDKHTLVKMVKELLLETNPSCH